MPDEQEKSGDLIAELAKLMAVGGTEPEVRPGPRPVQLEPTQTVPPPAPASTAQPPVARPVGIRIPGMDQPVLPETTSSAATLGSEAPAAAAPTPTQPTSTPAVSLGSPPQTPPASVAPSIRIPGMERPVPVSQQREPTIDFGALPPPVVPRPQPINDWQNREVPKSATERVIDPPKDASDEETEQHARRDPDDGEGKPGDKTDAANITEAPKPQNDPGHISFDFDLTGGPKARQPVAPATTQPVPAETTPAPKPVAPTQTGDPIADLIAAELDAGLSQPVVPTPPPAAIPVSAPQSPASQPPSSPVGAPIGQRPIEPRPRSTAPSLARPGMPRPPVATENDRFAVSPIFGPASKGGVDSAQKPPAVETPQVVPAPPVAQGAPTQRQAPPERDPMDEIESLIGEAVRVEIVQAERNAAARANGGARATSTDSVAPEPGEAPKAEARPQPPVVPPLTAGLPPRRAALKDTEPRMSAEEAVALTAAASVTAADGKKPVRPPKPEPIEARPKPPKAGRGMRQYVGMAVAGTLLLASGLGLYWVLTMGQGSSGDVPVLQADAEPVKKDPPAQASTNNGQGSVVFNEIEGKSDTSQEVLVSRDDSADTSIADVATPEPEATNTGETELANRKVRTVTVRPDGSIVSGDEAGSEALPVDRPNLPSLPSTGGDTQATDLLASVQSGTDSAATETPAATAAPQDAAAQLAAIEPSPGNVIDPNIVAPVPMPRVVDRSSLNSNSGGAATASAEPAPLDISGGSSGSEPRVVSGGSGTYVQLSSQRSQEEASAALRRTQQRLGSVVNGGALEIRRVDLGAKGIWYRVVLPTSSFQEATQACATIKANGGDCVAING